MMMIGMKFLVFVSIAVFFARCGDGINVGCQTVLAGDYQDPEEQCNEHEGHLLTCGTTWNPCPAVANIADIAGDGNCGECVELSGTGLTNTNIVIVGKVDLTDSANQNNRPNNKYYLTPEGWSALKGAAGNCYDPTSQADCTGCSQETSVTEGTLATCTFDVGCFTDMTNDAAAQCTDTSAHDDDCGTKNNPCPVAQLYPTGTVPDDGCDECFKLKEGTHEIFAHLVGKVVKKTNTPEAKYFVSSAALVGLGAATGPTCYDYGLDTGTSTLVTGAEVDGEFADCPNYGNIGCQDAMGSDHTDPEDACSDEKDGGVAACGDADTPCPLVAHKDMVPDSQDCGLCIDLETDADTPVKKHFQILGKVNVAGSGSTHRPKNNKYFTSAEGMKALGQTSPVPICYATDDGTACPNCHQFHVAQTVEDCDGSFSVGCQDSMTEADVDPEEECEEGAGDMGDCGESHNPCPAVAHIGEITGGTSCGECTILKHAQKSIHIQILGKATHEGDSNDGRPEHRFYQSSKGMVALGQASPVCYAVSDNTCTGCTQLTGVREMTDIGTCKFPVSCFTDMEGDGSAVCTGTAAHDEECGTKFNPCPVTRYSGASPGTDGCDECFKLNKGARNEIYVHMVGKADMTGKANAPKAKYFLSEQGLTALGGGSPTCYDYDGETGTGTVTADVEESSSRAECADYLNIGCQSTMGSDSDPADACTQEEGDLEDCGGTGEQPCPLVANQAIIQGAEKCGDCITLNAEDDTSINAQIIGKVVLGSTNRPVNKYYTSPAGLTALGLSGTPACYVIAGDAACPSCSQMHVEEKAGSCSGGITIGCQTTMTDADVDPENQCDEGAGHLETCGEDFNPCPAVANIKDIAGAGSCGECVILSKGTDTVHIQILGKADETKGNRPDHKYYLSPEGLKKLGVDTPVCYEIAADKCTDDAACTSVSGWTEAAPATCKFGVSCIDDMTTNKDPADVCSDLTAHDNTCGGSDAPCPATRNIAGFAGAEGCDECLKVKKDETEINIHVMGKIDITDKTNAPKAKYFLSSAGLVALGQATPTCHKIDNSQSDVSMLTEVTETSKSADCAEDPDMSIGCQTTMTETDVDPENECDEGAGHLETCGESYHPCPAVANINDITGGTSCGECVTLTKDTTTIHIQILGKADDTGSGSNRPDHKYYLSPEGLKKLGVDTPICYNIADNECSGGACSSVTGWTEAEAAECDFDVSCIDDMAGDNDPEGVCSGQTGHENFCGPELAPCPATRNMAGFPGATTCGQCFELTKGTTTIHAQMVGGIDISDKTNAPKVKYFLSSKGLERLGDITSPTCYKTDDTATGATTVEGVTEPGSYATCDEGSNLGCQTTMGDDTDPEDQCKDQGAGGLEACGEEATPCPLTANIEGVGTNERCGECLTLEKADGTKKHFEILGKVKMEGNRPENKFYTSPEGLKALGESDPTCYDKATDAACTSCSQVKVAEDDATCPTRTTGVVTTTKAAAAQLNAGLAALAAAALYAFVF